MLHNAGAYIKKTISYMNTSRETEISDFARFADQGNRVNVPLH